LDAKQSGIEDGVRMTAANMCCATSAMVLPGSTGERVYPTFYERQITVQSQNPALPWNGIAVVRPNLNEMLTIDVHSGPAINVSNTVFSGINNFDTIPVEFEVGARYSPAFTITDASGNTTYAKSLLHQTDDPNLYGQHPFNGEWLQGYFNAVSGQATQSTNAAYNNLVNHSPGATTNISCDVFIGEVDSSCIVGFGASASAASGATSGTFVDLTGAHKGLLTVLITQNDANYTGTVVDVRVRISSIDLTGLDPTDYTIGPATGGDVIYNDLKSSSTAFRITSVDLLVSWRGADTGNAGDIAIARVPEGTLNLNDPAICFSEICLKPRDKYFGKVDDGGHTFWLGKELDSYFLRPTKKQLLDDNILVCAWVTPPSAIGQVPALNVSVRICVDWVNDSPSLYQAKIMVDLMYMSSLFAILSSYNPSSSNKGHLAKIRSIAAAAAKNPVVRKAAMDMLSLGVGAAKKALPALMGGLLL